MKYNLQVCKTECQNLKNIFLEKYKKYYVKVVISVAEIIILFYPFANKQSSNIVNEPIVWNLKDKHIQIKLYEHSYKKYTKIIANRRH